MDKTCIKCGRCLAVCPVYQATRVETLSPRSKNDLFNLFLQKKIGIENIKKVINACLLCHQCEEVCILDINTPQRLLTLKQHLWSESQLPPLKGLIAERYLISLNKNRGIWLKLSHCLSQFSKLPFSLASKSFIEQHPFLSQRTSKTAIFLGCATNFIYPQLGEILIELLKGDCMVPAEQTCCGLMAHSIGNTTTAQKLAHQNIKAFQDAEIILTPCASCAYQLKTFKPYVESGLSKKVIPLEIFLVQNQFKPLITLNTPFTWHDPCHLRFGLHIWNEPRMILKTAGDFIETSPQGECCGGGGSFGLNYPDLSRKIFEKRRRHIDASRAELIFTSCMGCLLQFKLYLNQPHRIRHLLELLA